VSERGGEREERKKEEHNLSANMFSQCWNGRTLYKDQDRMRERDRGRERERKRKREIIREYNLSANMFPNAGMAELFNR
jgi:hypothetical protein